MSTETLTTTPTEPRVVLNRRTVPLGRWLLTGVVLGWFAVLILVPAVALVRAGAGGGLRAVRRGAGLARRAAGVRADAGHHGPGHRGQRGLRRGLRGSPGPPAVLGQDAGRRPGGPALRRLADHRGADADHPVRPAVAGGALARRDGDPGRLRLAGDAPGHDLRDPAVRRPRGRAGLARVRGRPGGSLPTRSAPAAGGPSGA